jgi:transposase
MKRIKQYYHEPSRSKQLNELNLHIEDQRLISIIKRDIQNLHITELPTMAEQIFTLYYSNNYHNNDISIIYTIKLLSQLFMITEKSCRKMLKKGERYIENNGPIKPGGKPKLSPQQESQLIDIIKYKDSKNKAITRRELIEIIQDKFGVHYTNEWVTTFISKYKDYIQIVNGTPLEKERASLSENNIQIHLEQLSKFVAECDPQLLINVDETGVGGVRASVRKKVIISLENNKQNHYYQPPRNDDYITFLVGIVTEGTLMKTCAIVKRLIVDSELQEFGLLTKYMIAYSQKKGYITKSLFIRWINEVLIPEVNMRRLKIGNLYATAGLIMDVLSCHKGNSIEKLLQDNNIKCFILPPHSSHVTQPLDVYTFSLFKTYYSNMRVGNSLTKQSQKLLRGMRALHIASTPWDIQNAFNRAGIMINYEENKVNVDRCPILSNNYLIPNKTIEAKSKEKSKRIITNIESVNEMQTPPVPLQTIP